MEPDESSAALAGQASASAPIPAGPRALPAAPFLGTYRPRLDDKGRIFLPAKYRDRFAEGIVITRGQEYCLYVWQKPVFDEIYQRLATAPVTDRAARHFVRMIASSSNDDGPDKQGRVTLNPELRDYAHLDKDCVVIGAGNRVEIWDATAWATYSAEQESLFADVSEAVLPGLI